MPQALLQTRYEQLGVWDSQVSDQNLSARIDQEQRSTPEQFQLACAKFALPHLCYQCSGNQNPRHASTVFLVPVLEGT